MNEEILKARQKLPSLDLSLVDERYHRVLVFDPSELYSRIHSLIKPYQRRQAIGMEQLFPDIKGYCACGCGRKLQGRRRRWATEDCNVFPLQVFWVIKGDTSIIGNILWKLYGWKCCKCNRHGDKISRPNKKDMRTSIEIEHILPVKHGGGGSWLSNYQLMCFECHRHKTNKDFGWKTTKSDTQNNLTLF